MTSVSITQEDFVAYVRVQMSGMTNMFATDSVEQLSGLTRSQILDIMRNYSKYDEQWPQVTGHPKSTTTPISEKPAPAPIVTQPAVPKVSAAEALYNSYVAVVVEEFEKAGIEKPNTSYSHFSFAFKKVGKDGQPHSESIQLSPVYSNSGRWTLGTVSGLQLKILGYSNVSRSRRSDSFVRRVMCSVLNDQERREIQGKVSEMLREAEYRIDSHVANTQNEQRTAAFQASVREGLSSWDVQFESFYPGSKYASVKFGSLTEEQVKSLVNLYKQLKGEKKIA